jgi:hypothetical protein
MSTTIEKLPAFEYLGHTFEPYSRQDGSQWLIDYIGDSLGYRKFERSESRRFAPIGYDHTDFYKAASKVGAGRHNIFLLDGWEVVPTNNDLLAFRKL